MFVLSSLQKQTCNISLAHLVIAEVCLLRCLTGCIAVGLWRKFHLMQLNWVSQRSQTHSIPWWSFMYFLKIFGILDSKRDLKLINFLFAAEAETWKRHNFPRIQKHLIKAAFHQEFTNKKQNRYIVIRLGRRSSSDN